jgi:hypothetical protein
MMPLMRRPSPGSNRRSRTRDGSGLRMAVERFKGIARVAPLIFT